MWKQTVYEGAPKTGKNPNSTYACETPITDGKRIYVYFGMHGLFCYDMEGELLWQKDLDAETGEEEWKVQRDEKTSYSSPIIWKNKIRTELITTGKTARSYDPETGKLYWELQIGGEQTIPSPVGDKEQLYLGNSGGREAKGNMFAVKAGAEGNITPAEGEMSGEGVAWTYPDAGIGNASPLLYNGLLYILSSRGGEIMCLNSINGEVVYKERVSGTAAVWASPWAYNDNIYFLDENGVTRVFKAGKEFELLPENRLEGKFWASVAITNDAYVFKGVEKLYCIKK